MTFLQKHWLGLTVLVLFVLDLVTMFQGPHDDFLVINVLFVVFFMVWAFRGFLRFCGRAWRHGATKG